MSSSSSEKEDSDSYEVPDGYFYTKDHEWIKPKTSSGSPSSSSSFLIGITDYAAKMLNDIVYVSLPAEGSSFKQKQVFGQVESVKTVSDLYTPISGKIVRTNSKLTQTPELVSKSPYADGWMLELESSSYSTESKDLLDAKAYSQYISMLKDTQ